MAWDDGSLDGCKDNGNTREGSGSGDFKTRKDGEWGIKMWEVICRSGFQHDRLTQRRWEMRKFGGKTLSLDSDNLHLRNHGTFTKGWVMTEQGANAGCEESGEAWEEVGMDYKNMMPCEQWHLCWLKQTSGAWEENSTEQLPPSNWPMSMSAEASSWQMTDKWGLHQVWAVPPWAGDPGLCKKSREPWKAFLCFSGLSSSLPTFRFLLWSSCPSFPRSCTANCKPRTPFPPLLAFGLSVYHSNRKIT